MHIFYATETALALPYAKLVPALAVAASELAAGKIRAPERQVVAIENAGVLLCMPAIAADIGVTKLVTVHAGNARHGLPVIQGEVVVFEAATGRRLMLLDGPTVTARRTAAMSLLGIQSLMRKKPASVLLIGTGAQALAHADALIDYFGTARFFVASRSPQNASDFCSALRQRYPAVSAQAISATSLETEMPDVDAAIALTTSRHPVMPENLPAHTLAIGVGAFKPDMAELPPALLQRRQIFVDDLAGARHEAGDLLQANIDWNRVRNLSALLAGEAALSTEAPVFKTVGQAAWDLAAARVALSDLGV